MKKGLFLLFIFCLQFTHLSALEREQSILSHISQALSLSQNSLFLQKFPAGVSNQVFLISSLDGKIFVAKVFTKKSYD